MARPRPPEGRGAAFEVLEGVELGGSSHTLLAGMDLRDERDQGLATSLVYGVLRNRTRLDRVIESVSDRPLLAIDARVLQALRLALYQILHLTRIPRSAAVDESVSIVRARCGRGAAAFANGVLRAVCRSIDAGRDVAALPEGEECSPARALAAKHSFPLFLVERFLRRHGAKDCEALLATLNRPAPVALRICRETPGAAGIAARLLKEGVETIPSPALAGALRVTRGAPQRSAVFREGLIYVQDEAAQIVTRLLQPLPSEGTLLDLCAAPGGKTLAAAQAAPPELTIVAADVSRERLRLLQDNARRLRVSRLRLLVADAEHPALRGEFERILLDAPCTGTGVIRRHPEIRWRRTPADIRTLALRQAEALRAAAALLAPGGRLVYSVCSLEPEEGPERVDALLAERPDLRTIDARLLLPAPLHPLVDGQGRLATLPHLHDLDGFYAAVIERGASVSLGSA